MSEIWKDITGFENHYQISNYGNIRSKERIIQFSDGRLRTYKSQLMRTTVNNSGYLVVTLNNGGRVVTKLVHRLVASAFIANPQNYPTVNHKDENRLNNNFSNLEWCTQSYNNKYGNWSVNQRDSHISNLHNNKLAHKIIQLTQEGDFVDSFMSIRDAERKTGIRHENISSVCRGKAKSAGGYLWQKL